MKTAFDTKIGNKWGLIQTVAEIWEKKLTAYGDSTPSFTKTSIYGWDQVKTIAGAEPGACCPTWNTNAMLLTLSAASESLRSTRWFRPYDGCMKFLSSHIGLSRNIAQCLRGSGTWIHQFPGFQTFVVLRSSQTVTLSKHWYPAPFIGMAKWRTKVFYGHPAMVDRSRTTEMEKKPANLLINEK